MMQLEKATEMVRLPYRLTPKQRKHVLPCPFCGRFEVKLGYSEKSLHWAHCSTCGTEFVGTRSLDHDAESLLKWWNSRDGVEVDPAIRHLKSAVNALAKLNPRKINVRFNFKNFTPVQRALTTCAVALDEFRMFYKRPYKRKNGR